MHITFSLLSIEYFYQYLLTLVQNMKSTENLDYVLEKRFIVYEETKQIKIKFYKKAQTYNYQNCIRKKNRFYVPMKIFIIKVCIGSIV